MLGGSQHLAILSLLPFSWLRWRGAKPAVELTIVLAVAFLSFYVGQSPAHVSRAQGPMPLPWLPLALARGGLASTGLRRPPLFALSSGLRLLTAAAASRVGTCRVLALSAWWSLACGATTPVSGACWPPRKRAALSTHVR